MNNLELGKRGEHKALEYLVDKNYTLISRNYRCIYGEIDIIVRDDTYLRIVEVKTRRSTQFGLPCESISERKRLHIKKCTEHFLQAHKLWDCDIAFDVIEIMVYDDETYAIKHHKSCF